MLAIDGKLSNLPALTYEVRVWSLKLEKLRSSLCPKAR